MVKVIFSILVVVFIIVVLGDTVRNFSSLSLPGFLTRPLPMLVLSAMALLGLLSDSAWNPAVSFSSYLLLADIMVLNAPSSFDEPTVFSLVSSGVVMLLSLLLLPEMLGFTPHIESDVPPLAVCAVLLAQSFFKDGKALPGLSVKLFLGLDMAASVVSFLHSRGLDESAWYFLSMDLILYIFLMFLSVKIFPGGFFFLPVKLREKDRDTADPAPETAEDSSRMDELFDRLEKFMQEREPYLDENLSLADLATAMLTNKTYLSKTINIKSGLHFCPYVNRYRVNYSLKIIHRDSRVKVAELALLSGFHSIASFNVAFRLFIGDTPSEYMRTLKAKKLYELRKPFQDDGTGAVI